MSLGNQTAIILCFNTPQISPLSKCPHGALGACDYNVPWRHTTGGLIRALLDRVGTQAANKAGTSAPTLIWRRVASVMRNVKVTGGSRPGVMKPQINSSPHQISREPLDSLWEPFRVTGSFSSSIVAVKIHLEALDSSGTSRSSQKLMGQIEPSGIPGVFQTPSRATESLRKACSVPVRFLWPESALSMG